MCHYGAVEGMGRLPGEARDAINKWIADGLSTGVGIFEGMPFQLTLFNNQPIQENFKAFLDFTKGYRDLPESGKLEVSLISDFSLDNETGNRYRLKGGL